MKISDVPKAEKLAFFQELYQDARTKTAEDRARLEQHLKQYKGDTAIDGSDVPADIVRNITYEFIESQVANNIPTPVASPEMYSELNERRARTVETLLNALRQKLSFKEMNDIDERYTYIYGGSVWLVEWDNSIVTHNSDTKSYCE